MFYTTKERVGIGREVFTHKLTKYEAAKKYDVSEQTIINYVRKHEK